MKDAVAIEHLIIQELIDLKGKIINRIKELRKREQLRAASQFRISDFVSFVNKDKLKIMGIAPSTRKTKIIISPEKLANLSPLGWEHIILTRYYRW